MKAYACLTLVLAPLTLTACTQERPTERPAPEPPATVVGEAQSCIPLTQIRQTRVRNDWTIDFEGTGGRVWRNALTSRCPGLNINDAITYKTSLTQLCNTDIVYVLETIGGRPQRGAACNLGDFVPVKLER